MRVARWFEAGDCAGQARETLVEEPNPNPASASVLDTCASRSEPDLVIGFSGAPCRERAKVLPRTAVTAAGFAWA